MALGNMAADAERACDFLKALTNPSRLMILCQLAEGEKSVGQLEELLRLRQPTLSQQLARLREDRLVEARRDGKMRPLPPGKPGGAAADRAALRAVLRARRSDRARGRRRPGWPQQPGDRAAAQAIRGGTARAAGAARSSPYSFACLASASWYSRGQDCPLRPYCDAPPEPEPLLSGPSPGVVCGWPGRVTPCALARWRIRAS